MMKFQNSSLYLITFWCQAILFSACSDMAVPVNAEETGDSAVVDQVDTVFLSGNAFITEKGSDLTASIESEGLIKWTNETTVISTYVRVARPGNLRIHLPEDVISSNQKSTISVRVNEGQKQTVEISGDQNTPYDLGQFEVDTGYVKIDLQGVERSANTYAEIPALLVSGEAPGDDLLYSTDSNYFYWARRGPSCHLAYTVPTDQAISYFYSEINVPKNQDPIGSYFMANGFGQGYFGIQVNAENERRVLFSVWSPFETDDPNAIPDEKKIVLNKKGPNVYTGEFGNEGSGGQSYLIYPWESEKTYRFLLRGEPDGDGKTDYTAWFHSPDENQWLLIASFKRPETDTHLTRFHSFLENFNPNQGYLGRQANYLNQWVRTADGEWIKVSEAKFTVDATYADNQRIDAMGGTSDAGYFLRNGGFFSDILEPGTSLEYTNESAAPDIDFDTLP
ncbi:MAG: DUF3472 domain-containing protein [Sphingobacterium sp.]